MTFVRVTDFRHGPRNARQLGGTFYGEQKVWGFDGKAEERFWSKRDTGWWTGLKLVSVKCPHYTSDQGCPLHSELCAPEAN